MRRVMSIVAVVACLACPCFPCWDDGQTVIAAIQSDSRSERVSFYEVPLTCPAARGLGCGSAAKPVLVDLEYTSFVDEAWLDQSGTTMAIVWARDSVAAERKIGLKAVAEARRIPIDELVGDALADAAKSFESGKGWHRAAAVDALSEQEAHVLADRLIARLTGRAPSAKTKTAALRPALVETIRQMLVSDAPSTAECREKIVALAKRHLNAAEMSALATAIDAGYRPIGDER